MPLQLLVIPPVMALPIFARLYGCDQEDLTETMKQLVGASVVHDESTEAVGAIGFRPTPAYGEEVMGGAFPGPRQHEAALALLQSAATTYHRLYAYAETHLLPTEVLESAGFHRTSAYTRMTGMLPHRLPILSPDFTLVPLSEVAMGNERLIAQQTYSDRIGHTQVPVEAGEPNFAGTDDALGRLAYDTEGRPAGICRVSLDSLVAHLGTPGVRTDFRGTGLRRALLLSACQAALAAGAVQLSLEAWGDTDDEREEDEALGLVVEACTPMYVLDSGEKPEGQLLTPNGQTDQTLGAGVSNRAARDWTP